MLELLTNFMFAMGVFGIAYASVKWFLAILDHSRWLH